MPVRGRTYRGIQPDHLARSVLALLSGAVFPDLVVEVHVEDGITPSEYALDEMKTALRNLTDKRAIHLRGPLMFPEQTPSNGVTARPSRAIACAGNPASAESSPLPPKNGDDNATPNGLAANAARRNTTPGAPHAGANAITNAASALTCKPGTALATTPATAPHATSKIRAPSTRTRTLGTPWAFSGGHAKCAARDRPQGHNLDP